MALKHGRCLIRSPERGGVERVELDASIGKSLKRAGQCASTVDARLHV